MSRSLVTLAFSILLVVPAVLAGMTGCSSSPPSPVSQTPPAPVIDPLAPRRMVSDEELAGYVGSETCVTCHENYAEQLQSHHAKTLAWADTGAQKKLFQSGQTFRDAKLGVAITPEVRNGQPLLTIAKKGTEESATVDFAFGSGNRCFTYVGRYSGAPYELRLSFYGKEGKWDLTPGHQGLPSKSSPIGRRLSRTEAVDCLLCHTTATLERGGQPSPQGSVMGVGCEACHGAGKSHIEAVKLKQTDLQMPRLGERAGKLTVDLCGQCHRTQEEHTDPNSPKLASQLPRLSGIALSFSKCVNKSGEKLSCLTCHNPHRNADRTSKAEYVAQCMSCHSNPAEKHVMCPVKPKGDCIPCHMPLQAVNMPTKPQFHNHWIKVYKK